MGRGDGMGPPRTASTDALVRKAKLLSDSDTLASKQDVVGEDKAVAQDEGLRVWGHM